MTLRPHFYCYRVTKYSKDNGRLMAPENLTLLGRPLTQWPDSHLKDIQTSPLPISDVFSQLFLMEEPLQIPSFRRQSSGAPGWLSPDWASWFWLGLWFQDHEIRSHVGLCARCGTWLRFSLSPSVPPLLSRSLSLSNKNKNKRPKTKQNKKHKHLQNAEFREVIWFPPSLHP